MIQLARPQRTLNLSSLSAYGTVSKGRAKGESMSEKGVYTPSCAPRPSQFSSSIETEVYDRNIFDAGEYHVI